MAVSSYSEDDFSFAAAGHFCWEHISPDHMLFSSWERKEMENSRRKVVLN